MSEKKDTILVASPFIACNQVCAALKEKGLPYDSVWLQIGHLINHLDTISCLADEQKQMIREAFDEYLGFIRKKEKAEVERHGREFLAEIDRLKSAKVVRSLKLEQEFNAELLNAISKNLHQLYAIIGRNDTCGMIDSLKADTLKSIKSAKNRDEILAIMEESFNAVHRCVKNAQEQMELSMESLLVLESNAIIDKLTGIFNRRFFDQELPKVIQTFLDREGKVPFSLLLIDIDKFKEVNDTYGHFIGDRVLQRVAAIIQNNCRAGIDSPIRLGGDEFALFLIGTNAKNAVNKGEFIRSETSRKPMRFTQRETDAAPHDVSFVAEVSIGVCELDLVWKDIDPAVLNPSSMFCLTAENNAVYKLACMLAEAADQALYEAKSTGRNRVCVYHLEADQDGRFGAPAPWRKKK